MKILGLLAIVFLSLPTSGCLFPVNPETGLREFSAENTAAALRGGAIALQIGAPALEDALPGLTEKSADIATALSDVATALESSDGETVLAKVQIALELIDKITADMADEEKKQRIDAYLQPALALLKLVGTQFHPSATP